MDWDTFTTPSQQRIYSFRKELFSDIFYSTWREYKKTDDTKILVAVLLQVMNDFPDLRELFDHYYDQYGDTDKIWSDKKIVFRFFQKLIIVYENIENQKV